MKFRLLVLVVAAGLDAVFGTPQLWERLPHPVVGIGKIISLCDRLGNRDSQSNRWRFISGLVTVALVLGVTTALTLVLAWLSLLPLGWGVEVLVVAVFLAMRNLTDHCLAVYTALPALPAARLAVAKIVGRDPEQLDEFAIARAATESLAENYSDGVIAPVFWYLLGGMVGMVGYKAINSLDSMIGHHSARYEYFGKAAARLDDAVNWLPARLTGPDPGLVGRVADRSLSAQWLGLLVARGAQPPLAQRRLPRGSSRGSPRTRPVRPPLVPRRTTGRALARPKRQAEGAGGRNPSRPAPGHRTGQWLVAAVAGGRNGCPGALAVEQSSSLLKQSIKNLRIKQVSKLIWLTTRFS